jgi:hypothetical protein
MEKMKPQTNEMELPIEAIQIHPEVLPFLKPRKASHIEYTMKMSSQITPILGNFVDGVFYITDGVIRYELAKKLGLKYLKCLHVNISAEDVIKVRMMSNQRCKMSYMEIATYAEHTLGIFGNSQGKKRDEWLGMTNLEEDKNFGLAGKDRFELTCHLLDLPVKASSLRKLMSIHWHQKEDSSLRLIEGLDEGIYSIDSAYRLVAKDNKINIKNHFKKNRIEAIQNANVWCKVFNQSSDDLSNLKKYKPKFAMFSPPYWKMKYYRNQGEMRYGRESTLEKYITNSRKFIDALTDIMDKDGVVVIVIGERYTGGYYGVINEYENMLKASGLEIIGKCPWIKTNPTPVNVNNFFRPADEMIFVCKIKGGSPVFNPTMVSTIDGEKSIKESHKSKNGAKRHFLQDGERIITNIIETPVCDKGEFQMYDPEFDHDAPCPMAVYDAFVESYTLPGMTCIDIYCGAGQGLEVFSRWGCNAIGVDIDPLSVEFCRKRMDMVLVTNQKEVLPIAA